MARTLEPLDFGRDDLAGPVDASPMLFDSIKVCCKDCGSALVEKTYQFFPSTLFIQGRCAVHGARSAMFAPATHETEGQREVRHRHEHLSFLDSMPPHVQRIYEDIVNAFIQYVQDEDAKTTEGAKEDAA